MTTSTTYEVHPGVSRPGWRAPAVGATRGAWRMLQFAYAALALVAGIDKFAMVLVDWSTYLAPSLAGMVPVSPLVLMWVVGAIEIIAGLIVLFRPSVGGALVGIWLLLISFNLFLHPAGLLDIALRDLVLALGAFALGRLSRGMKVERI